MKNKLIKNSCGGQGCDIKKYVLPYGYAPVPLSIIKKNFRRDGKSKTKSLRKVA